MLGKQFIRFLAVGIANSGVGYGLFALLIWCGLSYPVAIALATVAGVAFNFQTTGRLVFGSADKRLMFKFVIVYAVVYVISLGLVTILLRSNLNVYVAYGLSLPIVAVITFFLQRKFVFKTI